MTKWLRSLRGTPYTPGQPIARYFLALVLLTVAVGLRVVFNPWLGQSLSHPTVFTAILAVCWFCGIGPAIFVAILGYAAIEYLVVNAYTTSLPIFIVSICFYTVLSATVIAVVASLQKERERSSLLSSAIEAAANSILVTDRQGQILWVNRAFTNLTGYELEEVIGKTPRILKSGKQPPEFYQGLWETVLGGELWQGQLVNRRKDGSLYHEELTITPIRTLHGEISHFVGIMENVTQRKEIEDMLRAAKTSAETAKGAAERANRAKDHFLAVLSHELRTPLTPVLAAVQLMQRKPEMRAAVGTQLEMISRNVQLEARLIDDLLDLTRIARGKLTLERKPIMLCTAIHRAVEICKPDLEARKQQFGLEMEGAPYIVRGDVTRLQQVLWNLLNNAVKFTPQGGRVTLRSYREDGQVITEVADSGIGIDPDAVDRIFDAFEQAEHQITRQFGGLGLGLAISKRLVEMHAGTLSVHSEGRGRGAMFRITLPIVQEEPDQPAESLLSTAVRQSKHILLVEDHGDTAKTTKLLLESYGYAVETAGDVKQALEAVDSKKFDLMISDLGLPDKSGLELMHEVRQRGHMLRGIALSGYGREEDIERSHEAGFSMHMTKPVDAEALAAAVERMA